MTRPERRKELAKQWEAETIARAKEETRKAALTMWERIDEADASADVKEILHLMADWLGMDQPSMKEIDK